MDFASTDVEIPLFGHCKKPNRPLTKLRNNRRKRVLQTDQCNLHVQCFHVQLLHFDFCDVLFFWVVMLVWVYVV